ncbi:MAG: transglutaminase family protein, partial [Alphaproteobacteria bacterium]|nr:transglutaminase family protein [Alphaproteobacteria bacterium]
MLIRCGYEITLRCEEPTALVCLLSVHPDRMADSRGPETFSTDPEVAASGFIDPFGNRA